MAPAIPPYDQPAEVKVLVAGGGLAGAAAAAALAQSGAEVTLIERQAAPVHKICGEFLSAEAQSYLAKLGLDLARFQGAPISRLRLVRGKNVVETALPFHGIGLSRRKLDEALLLHAGSSGARILRGQTIRKLDADSTTLQVENAGIMTPETLLLATGKHELRGAGRNAATQEALIGFKMYFRLARPAQAELAQYIELIFFAGGYAGLQMIEDNTANLCLLIKREQFRNCGGTWTALLEYLQKQSPYLAAQLQGAAQEWEQPLSITRVPYGFIHRHRPGDPSRLFRLGDQACVIHSFTGDGMAIALHSAALAVRSILQGETAETYHRQLARDVRGQMNRANMLSAALNNAVTQPMMFAIAKLWPKTLQKATELTRVPLHARL